MNLPNIEFNSHAVYIRNRELSLHYKKLNEINSRKNIFLSLVEKPSKPSKKKKRVRVSLEREYRVNKDNNYLSGKLYEISQKEIIKPLMKNSKSHESVRHFVNVQTMRKMKEKSIQEENLFMMRRLEAGESVMNVSKLEDEFKRHLKIKKLLKKETNFAKLYKENELPVIEGKLDKKIKMSNSNYGNLLRNSWNDSGIPSRRVNHSVYGDFYSGPQNKFVQYSNLGIIDLKNFEGFERKK